MSRASMTALGIAALRALERERPPAERIVDDPYARHFVGEWLFRVMTFFDHLGWGERRGPGVQGYIVARERAIDDLFLRMLGEGMEQAVILGAGYDARAYRFARPLRGVRVFEVDEPATQEAKKARLAQISDEIDGAVTMVPLDLEQRTLRETLIAAGYDPTLRTVFIMQGVMMYLTAEAMDDTLRFVRTSAATGSAILFDYTSTEILKGGGRTEVRKTNRYARFGGEQVRLGMDPVTATAWLEERGFTGVEHLRSEQLHDLYFHGPNASRSVTTGYGILLGRVPG